VIRAGRIRKVGASDWYDGDIIELWYCRHIPLKKEKSPGSKKVFS